MNLHQAVHCVGITLIYTLKEKKNFNMGICQQGPKSSPKFIIKKFISKKKKKKWETKHHAMSLENQKKKGGKKAMS